MQFLCMVVWNVTTQKLNKENNVKGDNVYLLFYTCMKFSELMYGHGS